MEYKVEVAQKQLGKLVDAALAGEDVVLAKGATPVVRLVAVPPRRKGKFKFGILAGKVAPPPADFFEPLSPEDLAAWEGSGDPNPA